METPPRKDKAKMSDEKVEQVRARLLEAYGEDDTVQITPKGPSGFVMEQGAGFPLAYSRTAVRAGQQKTYVVILDDPDRDFDYDTIKGICEDLRCTYLYAYAE